MTDADTQPTVTTTALFWALKRNDKPLAILEGSSGSSKTWSILQYLIDRMLREKVRVFAGRHDGATCDASIVTDFRDVMQGQFQLWDRKRWNATRRTYTFPTGAEIRFGGTKDEQKLHGPRQDILWLNEVMEIPYESWAQLTMRTRLLRILDFNPSLTRHWVFDRLMSRDPDEYLYLHSTFEDNPYLAPDAKAEILAYEPTAENVSRGTADPWRWKVYGLGQRGVRENVIYRLWDTIDEWPEPHLCPRWGFGLDFGYSADPSALVECCIWNEDLCLREHLYEPGLVANVSASVPDLPSIEGRMRELQIPTTPRIWADCARPEAIAGLRAAGWNVAPSEKGAGSVVAGIDLVRQHRIRVYRASQNLQAELQQYRWHKDPSGRVTDEPEDEWNHALDAVRYWALGDLQPRKRHGRSRARVVRSRVGKRSW